MELVIITPKNYEQASKLSVYPEQEKLIASIQKSLADSFVHKGALFKLAVHKKCVIGYVMIFPYKKSNKNLVNIVRIMIDKNYQGKGLGKELLNKTIMWIKRMEPKVSTIRISTKIENTLAIGLYESEGFVQKGIEDGEIALYKDLTV